MSEAAIHVFSYGAIGWNRISLSIRADALADIAAGKFVVVTDDEDRENEGDLIMAADRVTEEAMAFMVSNVGGMPRSAFAVNVGTPLASHLRQVEETSG